MTLIGTGLTLIGQGLMLIVAFMPLVLFSVLSFWRPNPVLFMLSAGVSLMTGFYYYDTYVTNLGLTLGLCLLAFSLFCLGMAYRTLFWKGPRE